MVRSSDTEITIQFQGLHFVLILNLDWEEDAQKETVDLFGVFFFSPNIFFPPTLRQDSKNFIQNCEN